MNKNTGGEATMVKSRFNVPKSAEVMARRDFEWCSVMEYLYPSKLTVTKHAHQFFTFGFVLRGQCSELCDGERRELTPLSVQFLPPGETHSLAFDGGMCRSLGVAVSGEVLTVLQDPALKLENAQYHQGGQSAWLFSRLYKEFVEAGVASQISIQGLTLELLAEFSRQQTYKVERTPPKWLQKCRELFHEHFLEELSISSVAQAVGVHPAHLSREFRRHYRSTIGEYIRRLRIDYSCEAMLNSELSLSEIAHSAGFADQSHFIRTFRHYIGVSPGVFRSNLSR